jgi:hypothetical protein
VTHCNGIEIAQRNTCDFECFVYDWPDALQVGPAGDFRYDAVVQLVQFVLGRHNARSDIAITMHHGGSCFITTRFNTKRQ